MKTYANDTPNWVQSILMSDAIWLLARILLTFLFWMTALSWISNFAEARGAAASVGLAPAAVWGGIIIALYVLGTIAIIFDRYMWLGAGAFGVFILLTILLVHRFWAMTGNDATVAWNEVKEHISLIGAMIAVCIAGQARRRLVSKT
jgi:transmembrane protein